MEEKAAIRLDWLGEIVKALAILKSAPKFLFI
jgi:hypothetical protein